MKNILGQKHTFTATRGSTAIAQTGNGDLLVCLENIKLNSTIVKDHSWTLLDKRIGKVGKGEVFQFTATVTQYLSLDKDYNQVLKYRFDKIRNVKIVGPESTSSN